MESSSLRLTMISVPVQSPRASEKLPVSGRIVSSYWPFRGEPDLRNWAIKVIEQGGRIALPVVLRKAEPLEFRVWQPGDPLERGVWNILVPSRGPAVLPDVVIAPVVLKFIYRDF